MIVIFTDFGLEGPYVGQMKAALHQRAPSVPVVDLFADAPRFDPRASAYLLPAYVGEFPPGSVFLCVVDPGVGTARGAVAVNADGRWFVGPDNGVFSLVSRRAGTARWHPIVWKPPRLSASFHGRDLFAPVAASLAIGEETALGPLMSPSRIGASWPDDLPEIVYVDTYGNAMSGIRAETVSPDQQFEIAGRTVRRAETFGDVPPGSAFWYANANGLVEFSVNRGQAHLVLGLRVGTPVCYATTRRCFAADGPTPK